MFEVDVSLGAVGLGVNENGLNGDVANGKLSIDGNNKKYIDQLEQLDEEILPKAGSIEQYYQLMRDAGVTNIEMDGAPTKVRNLGRSGVVILTHHGALATTKNLPDSIRESIESMTIDSPDVMNKIEDMLKAGEIDYRASYTMGRAEDATGRIEIGIDNPAEAGFADTASGRRKAGRNIAEDNTYGTYSENETHEVARSLTEDEMARLKAEFEEKYGKSTRGNDGPEMGK